MHQARQESTQDRALTHTSSKFTLALVAVWSLGLGVLLRDVAQDWIEAPALAACEARSSQYASKLAKLLTDGGNLTAPGTVVSCKAKHLKVNS
jgi:hypothetical protein